MTRAQRMWLDEHPEYVPIGRPAPNICFKSCGTLYADGSFDQMGPMKPIVIQPQSFGVGIPRRDN